MQLNMKSLFVLAMCAGGLFSCQSDKKAEEVTDYTRFVDPTIGTGGHGHVFIGASLPHGMVQLGPNNLTKGWDWCSGYHDSDSTIVGFAHTHLSGTGIADLGDILFMPVTGDVTIEQGTPEDLSQGYVSLFSKASEVARPGYYSVMLDKYNIKAQLTATERVGFHQYNYPEAQNTALIIDLNESTKSLMARKGTLSGSFTLVNDSTVAGYRISDEWATDHRVYFTTRFSKPIKTCQIYKENELAEGLNVTGVNVKAVLTFDCSNDSLLVKTGISYTSVSGAAKNLETELNHWDFGKVRTDANEKWNDALSQIDFQSTDEKVMKIFYTSLFHTQISPSLFSDVDGLYRGADGVIRNADGFTPYTIFSLWDTYRGVHPLYTLVDHNVPDYVNTLLSIYDEQGRMPVWHLAGNETDCMVGVHSIPVVVDACLKGFSNINYNRAFEAVKSIESRNDRGLDFVREKGYIPAENEVWSVAKALEYAVDDYAVSKLAHYLEEKEEEVKFAGRSKNYTHYFDAQSRFMRGRMGDGTWRKNFDPFHSIHLEDDYVEGNAWQYTWLVPHDVEGLVTLFGGEEPFLQKFDSLFTVSSDLNEGASIDITGMIGQYAHGNEPSHHILYMYGYVGRQWRTAELVRTVYDQFYQASPNGLIGNEDCGQMSAWYVFSAMGFYPVNPVNGAYVFGSPLADRATLRLNNGKHFTVEAKNNSAKNKYIQSVTLNGTPYTKAYILHRDIMAGGKLEFVMGHTPNKTFGSAMSDRACSNTSF